MQWNDIGKRCPRPSYPSNAACSTWAPGSPRQSILTDKILFAWRKLRGTLLRVASHENQPLAVECFANPLLTVRRGPR